MNRYHIASDTGLTDLPDRIVVAPAHGRLSMTSPGTFTTEGEVVRAGDVIAVIGSAQEDIELRAPCDAWVLSYLARDGERVHPGRPVVHLRAL